MIFDRLFRRGTAAETGPARRVEDGLRLYAIGDVHGRADLLEQLLADIARDLDARPPPAARLVFLGDYVDRGLQSRAVLERLAAGPLPGVPTDCLLGNHEAMLLDTLDGACDGVQWLAIGGTATLYSYGIGLPRAERGGPSAATMLQEALAEHIPAAHLALLRGLKPYVTSGDYAFVHAGVSPGLALERQTLDDLIWIREPFLSSKADHGYVIVHGHTITATPELRRNRIGIDTGAFASGVLTALVLEGEQRRFLATGPLDAGEPPRPPFTTN